MKVSTSTHSTESEICSDKLFKIVLHIITYLNGRYILPQFTYLVNRLNALFL